MIFLVHGQNTARSREVVLQLKQKFESLEKLELSILETTPAKLFDAISTYSIFDKPPFVVLDVSGSSTKNLDEYIDVLEKIPAESICVIYSSAKLPKSNGFVKASKKLKIKEVSSEQVENSQIFKFVDAVFEGNRKKAYKELNVLLNEGNDPFYIFSMILYGLRNVAYAAFDSPHFKKGSSFVISKSQKQAKNFTHQEIKELFEYFYTLDKNVKTGEVPVDLYVPLSVERVLKLF